MKKLWMVVVLACAVIAGGCVNSRAEKETGEKADQSDKMQIGVTLDTKILERWIRDAEVLSSTAHKLGAEVDIQIAAGDVETQKKQIDFFIQEKKDVIVVIAVDCEGIGGEIQRARAQGIKVVSYDRLITDTPTDLLITFRPESIGQLMADAMIEEIPSGGRIVMIKGSAKDSNVGRICQSFRGRVESAGLTIVYEAEAKGWKPETGFEVTNNLLGNGIQFDGIMCGNDGIAVQAIQALIEGQNAGTVCVTGQDADVEACQRIVEGTQKMTVYKDLDLLAKKAAELLVMLAQDIPLDEVTDSVEVDGHKVPAVYLEPIAVTKENIDQVIIESGFHLKEEVYLNAEQDTQ